MGCRAHKERKDKENAHETHRMYQTATVAFLCLLVCAEVQAQMVPLPSGNDGPAKKAILEFVQATTDQSSPKFVPPEARIATFDQDGTLWVEHPLYTQVLYCLERVPVLAAKKPELKNVEPFKTVLSGNREAMAKLTMPDSRRFSPRPSPVCRWSSLTPR